MLCWTKFILVNWIHPYRICFARQATFLNLWTAAFALVRSHHRHCGLIVVTCRALSVCGILGRNLECVYFTPAREIFWPEMELSLCNILCCGSSYAVTPEQSFWGCVYKWQKIVCNKFSHIAISFQMAWGIFNRQTFHYKRILFYLKSDVNLSLSEDSITFIYLL